MFIFVGWNSRWLPQQVETGPYGKMKITNSQKKRNMIEPKQSVNHR